MNLADWPDPHDAANKVSPIKPHLTTSFTITSTLLASLESEAASYVLPPAFLPLPPPHRPAV